MKWFHNMKIRPKLVGSFILLALIVLLVGSIGTINLSKLKKSDTELYENMTVPISQLEEISTAFQRVRVDLRDMVTANDPKEI